MVEWEDMETRNNNNSKRTKKYYNMKKKSKYLFLEWNKSNFRKFSLDKNALNLYLPSRIQ